MNLIFRNVLKYFSVNLITACLHSISIFTLSYGLTVSDFGMFRLLTLYVVYGTVIGLGTREAIFLRLCKKANFVKFHYILTHKLMLIQFALLFCFMTLCLLIFQYNILIFMTFFIVIFFNNFVGYYIEILKASKRAVDASLCNFYFSLSFFIIIMLLFLTKRVFIDYVLIAFMASSLIRMVLVYKFYKYERLPPGELRAPKLKLLFKYVRFGFPIMGGNLALLGIDKLDQLLMSIILPVEEFASYSLASAMLLIYMQLLLALSINITPYIISGSESFSLKYSSVVGAVFFLISTGFLVYGIGASLFYYIFTDYSFDGLIFILQIIYTLLCGVYHILVKPIYWRDARNRDFMLQNVMFIILTAFTLFVALHFIENKMCVALMVLISCQLLRLFLSLRPLKFCK